MIQMVTYLMETNLSLTFQGDFCVSMTGRGALRCKKTRLAHLQRPGGMQDRRAAAVVEMDVGKRKMKKISKLQHVKLLRNGPTRGVNTETALRVLHSDLRNQLICCGADKGKRQIRDNRSVLQERSAEEENAKKKNGRKGEIMACVLRAPQQVTCSTDVRAAQQHPSAAPQPPSHLEKKPSPADNAHIIVYCMLVYTTRTCSNDVHAARRQRTARAQRRGQCLPGRAATLHPKSSPPVRGEGVVVAKTRRAEALAQRRRSTSENRANQHETQTTCLVSVFTLLRPPGMMITLRQCHVAAAQPKRNAVIQQLDDAVDEVALQRPRPGTASPHTPTARDASYDGKRQERQL